MAIILLPLSTPTVWEVENHFVALSLPERINPRRPPCALRPVITKGINSSVMTRDRGQCQKQLRVVFAIELVGQL